MEYKINYETLYKRVSEYINNQYDTYFKKQNEKYTIENKVRVEVYGNLQAAMIGFEKQTENFEERYNLLKNHIDKKFEDCKNANYERYSIENSTRFSEYFHMIAVLVGNENNARNEAIDAAYMN
jgi:hypothetical protein